MKFKRLGDVAVVSLHMPKPELLSLGDEFYVAEYFNEKCIAGSMDEAMEALCVLRGLR